MLSIEQAKTIADEFRPQFSDPALFETSWSRYMDYVKAERNPAGLEQWLRSDLEQDKVRSVGVVKEPLLPTQSQFDLNGCYHCYGRGFVRLDVEISHPQFGKAQPCPVCSKSPGDPASHCAKCTAFVAESKS